MKKVFLWLIIVSIIALFILAGCKDEIVEEVTETVEEETVGEAEEEAGGSPIEKEEPEVVEEGEAKDQEVAEEVKEEAAEELVEEEANKEIVKEVLTAPTIRLEIIEGPTLTADGVCYYRVKAIVTGNPYPAISFNKDDSLGSWGKNISQVNLYKEGDSFTLEATATNSKGTASASITLTDTLERSIVEVKPPKPPDPEVIWDGTRWVCTAPWMGPSCHHANLH